MKKMAYMSVIVGALLMSCGSQTPSDTSGVTAPTVDTSLLSTEDQVAAQFPNFAGFYAGDVPGEFNILLAGESIQSLALADRSKIESTLTKAYNLSTVAAQSSENGRLVTQQVQPRFTYKGVKYSLKQLNEYQRKIETLMQEIGIELTSLNIRNNRLDVYTSKPAGPSVSERIQSLGIPADAFRIAGTAKYNFSAYTTDYVRPVGAGLGISTPLGGCSMSSPVKRVSGTQVTYGFITARHCVNAVGDAVTQGGYSLGTAQAVAPTVSGSVDADAAFISTTQSSLRSLQVANVAYGYNASAQYSGWLTYPNSPQYLTG